MQSVEAGRGYCRDRIEAALLSVAIDDFMGARPLDFTERLQIQRYRELGRIERHYRHVFGCYFVRSPEEVEIWTVWTEPQGAGHCGRFLDSLPQEAKITFVGVTNPTLGEMLKRRGYTPTDSTKASDWTREPDLASAAKETA